MGAAASRKRPISSKEIDQLFNSVDRDFNGKVTIKEVCAAVATHGKDIQAEWPNERITEVMKKHAKDKNGTLRLKEFRKALRELYKYDPGTSALRRAALRLSLATVQPERPPPFSPDCGTTASRAELSDVYEGQLFLTNYKGAENREGVLKLGVTHIVSVGTEFVGDHPLADAGVKYWQTEVTDDEEQADVMKQALDQAVDFIKRALKGGGKVLVHCAAGISRSTTVVLAFLMARGFTLREAFEHTIARRRVVWPNNGFMGLLIAIESKKRKGKPTTMSLRAYARWGDFDEAAYYAARVVDRESMAEASVVVKRRSAEEKED
jgi:protein-tyrosine phosphatase